MPNRTISFNLVSDTQISPMDAAYVAGFFDGEGTLSIMRTRREANRTGFRYMPLMSVANTHKASLERVRDMCGNGRIIGNYHKGTANHRIVYQLRFSSNQIRGVLPQLRPYLFVKANQADLLLAFLAMVHQGVNPSQQTCDAMEALRLNIKSMNTRGQSVETPIDPVFLRDPKPGYRHQGYVDHASTEPVN